MKLPKETKGGTFELTPAGNHLGVCFMVVDFGTQKSTFADGEKLQRTVHIGWELPHEMMQDGRPFMVSRRYNFSTNEKATFRLHLESWRGKKFTDEDFGENGFDVRNLLGKGCFVQVVHNERGDKTYANIASIASLPKGTAAPELINKQVYLSLESDEFDPAVYESLPEWMQDTIALSPEYQALVQPARKAETPQELNDRFRREAEEYSDDDSPPF